MANPIRVKDINGSLKVERLRSANRTIKRFLVKLYRGSEEKLLQKLNGDLTNLLAFCDNGNNFNDLTHRHYGGRVVPVWFKEYNNSLSLCYSQDKPDSDYYKGYEVEVYID